MSVFISAKQVSHFVDLQANIVFCTQEVQKRQCYLVDLICESMSGLMSAEDTVTGGKLTVPVLL